MLLLRNGRTFFTILISKKMKNAVLIFLALFLAFAACKNNQAQNTAKTPAANQSDMRASTMYACPMHPEVTGMAGDKCPKCNMALTQTAHTAAHYSCPMHPEVTGKAGDKCSKCNMDLMHTEHTATYYSCPMHPEITGKKGDKCTKCNMDLTNKQ